jgi:mRNA interferase HigB
MRIIARRTLKAFVASLQGHKDQSPVKAALDNWYRQVNRAVWVSSANVKTTFATASIVSADRLVFNIKGNSCRLIAAVDYEKALVWIIWIGTHRDYDAIDARTVRHVRN